MAFRPEPEKRPSRFSRQPEEEEELEQPPRRPFSPFRPSGAPISRPTPAADIPELWDVMIPQAELEDPSTEYRTFFEQLPYHGRVAAERREAREPARGPRPGAPPPGPPPSGMPARGRQRIDPGRYFNLDSIWGLIRKLRSDTRFSRGRAYAIQKVIEAVRSEQERIRELGRVFGLEEDIRRAEDAWGDVLGPFLDDLSQELNRVRPNDIPGEFGFQPARDGSFWLGYMER